MDKHAALTTINKMKSDHKLPTGFNIRPGNELTLGTLEFCLDADSGEYETIDHLGHWSKITGATHFRDGVTPLTDMTVGIGPSNTNGTFSYTYNGALITHDTFKHIQCPATSGKLIITFNKQNELEISPGVYDAIMVDVLVSVISINPTYMTKNLFASERHGNEKSSASHWEEHETTGAKWVSGLDIVGLAEDKNSFDSIEAGVMRDEDIRHTSEELLEAPFLYIDGEDYVVTHDTVNNLLGYKNDDDKVVYNHYDESTSQFSLAPIGNDYVICHFFKTNDGEHKVFKLIGQNLYTNRGNAKKGIFSEMILIKQNNMTFPEFLYLGCCIIHDEDTGQIELGVDKEINLDCRREYPIPRY